MRLQNRWTSALVPLSLTMTAALAACGDSSDGEGGDESSSASTEDDGVDDDGDTSTAPGTEDEGTEDGADTSSEDGADTSTDDAGTDDSGTDDGSTTDTGGEVEPSFEIVDISRPIDVTPDGTVALFEEPAELLLESFFYDTVTGEITPAATIGDAAFDFSTGVSDTLRISALHGVPVQAGLWTEAGGWLDLASPYETGCDDVASAWDISADGSVAVGMAWNGCSPHAFRWVDDGGAGTTTELDVIGTGFDGNAPSNRATVVSDDGMVVAGFAQNGAIDRAAAVWQADGTGVLLAPDEEWPQEVLSISADGQMVAGTRGYDGFYWTEADGMTSLGQPAEAKGPANTFPNAIAAGGELVAGGFGDPWGFSVPLAFVWTRDEGMRSLQPIVEANGLVVPEGIALTNVIAASADGSVLIGSAYDAEGYPKSWVLRLAPSAYGL